MKTGGVVRRASIHQRGAELFLRDCLARLRPSFLPGLGRHDAGCFLKSLVFPHCSQGFRSWEGCVERGHNVDETKGVTKAKRKAEQIPFLLISYSLLRLPLTAADPIPCLCLAPAAAH